MTDKLSRPGIFVSLARAIVFSAVGWGALKAGVAVRRHCGYRSMRFGLGRPLELTDRKWHCPDHDASAVAFSPTCGSRRRNFLDPASVFTAFVELVLDCPDLLA
ncbi:MAG TPA: hypothetical protein VF472_14215 [Burkholderiaceae bacterium]